MRKVFAVSISMVIVAMMSGCAAIGKSTRVEDGGRRSTVGLVSIDCVSDGYPMIPLYSSFKKDK